MAAYLLAHENEILDRWTAISEDDAELPVPSRLTRDEFHNNIPNALEGLARALEEETVDAVSRKIRDEVAKHGHHRWKQGFNLHELTRDWGNLNRVLIGVIGDFYSANPTDDEPRALTILAEFMTEAMSNSVRRFDELRRAEAASLEQDLVAMKERFEQVTRERGRVLREAAHDLRGNLSTIALSSTLFRLQEQTEERVEDLADRLERNVATLQEMIESLLDLSRLESGADPLEVEDVDVAALLNDMADRWRPAAEAKNLELRVEGPKTLEVQTDPTKLERIVQNLMVNALKYTSEGHIVLGWRGEASRWILSLRDTGSGMQEEQGTDIAHQLDAPEHPGPDPERKPQPSGDAFVGEGIGLMIVKRLCEVLDAGIFLESEPGAGTTVTVELPLGYPEPRRS